MTAPLPTTYSLEWLLEALAVRGALDARTLREVEVKAPQQRARLTKQAGQVASAIEGGGSSRAYSVSPAELVASFALTDPGGQEIDEDYLARLVAEEAGLPYYKVDPLKLDMGLVTRTLSRPFALRHVVLPLWVDEQTLVVAIDNPYNPEVLENLRRIDKGDIRRVVSSKRDIYKCLTEIFGFRRSVEKAASETQQGGLSDFEQLVELRHVADIEASDKHIVNAVDFLFSYAFDQRASDIHVEPRRGDSQVRLRIDGVLHSTHRIPRGVHPAMVSRLKMLSRMDIAERRRPQDGRIKTVLGNKEVELRVSTLPAAFGEKVVVRVFDPDALLQDVSDLGFDEVELGTFQRWIGAAHGLLLITGPTGSGKTTTLYTTLKALADDTVNITTVEDPIEMITDQFNQVAVQPRIGVDFPAALRTILRQDPDIIMVGEIRDPETAEMAVQAALTGHLVLSTLHTNDSVGAIARLRDLGVPGFLIGSTVIGVMAQRLVRRICVDCSVPQPLTVEQLRSLDPSVADPSRSSHPYKDAARGAGCPKCRSTGFLGRIGIFEMLDFTRGFRDCVLAEAPEDELRSLALEQGLRPLRQAALRRLAQGVTAFEEVVRVVGPVAPTAPEVTRHVSDST